jgi:hypothetical protein
MTYSHKPTRNRFMRATLAVLLLGGATATHASGNHPEAGACSEDKPYFAICTHSLHSLEGWYSRECFETKEEAQQRAEAHAQEYHNGNMRWTGIRKQRSSNY